MNIGLMPGALVWRKDVHVGLADHYGAVLTDDLHVAHIDKSEVGHLRVKVEVLDAFASGIPWFYEPRAEPVPLATMWPRVQEIVQAHKPFGLLCWGESWNCESFARFVRNGIAHSKQAASANGVLALVGLALLFGFVLGALSEDDGRNTNA